MKRIFVVIQIYLCFNHIPQIVAQDLVDVNLQMRHSVNGVSIFDRSKYIVLHDDLTGNEWDSHEQQKGLLEEYDVYFGRNNGGIVWEYNNTREDPTKPGWPDVDFMRSRGSDHKENYASNTFVHQFENRYSNMMIGGQEHMFPHGQATSRHGLVYEGFESTAEFYAQYILNFFGEGTDSGIPKPKMVEVINEPFVKANKLGTTRQALAEYHNVISKRIKELNPKIMVGGYSAAHPAFEDADFNHWRNCWKMFIDVAGENMDFFSFHLYDFIEETSDMSREKHRSGSNIEAIMDMINHYSVIALGETKPWSISEYGWLCKNCEGGYDPKEDWYNLRSFNTMMVQLMERPDQIINTIPFMLLKANWAKPANAEYNTYGPRLLREIGEVVGEPAHGGWIYTHLLKYFELWSDVNGVRVDSWASDPDILVDAYVEGNQAYIIVCNLEERQREIDLTVNGISISDVRAVHLKHLYAIDDLPVLDTSTSSTFPTTVSLGSQATLILKLELADEVKITEELHEKTYFAETYLQPIHEGKEIEFRFANVHHERFGEAMLRIGIGRDHGKSLKPQLKFNGEVVTVPNDWKGYDQQTRDRFFGVIEVSIPYDLVHESNAVELTFGDTGGHISSLGLQIFNATAPIQRRAEKDVLEAGIAEKAFEIYPNPVEDYLMIERKEMTNFRLFDAAGQQLCSGLIDGKATLDMREFRSGLYYIIIENETYKVVKH